MSPVSRRGHRHMSDATGGFDPSHLDGFVGTWAVDGAHALLPGEPIRGETSFEWLGGGPFLVQRSSFDHPKIPDGITLIGLVDARPCMSYFDARGVHRVYDVETREGVLLWTLTSPGFSQRYVAEVRDGGRVIEASGELSRDDVTWQRDLSLTYRRPASARGR